MMTEHVDKSQFVIETFLIFMKNTVQNFLTFSQMHANMMIEKECYR